MARVLVGLSVLALAVFAAEQAAVADKAKALECFQKGTDAFDAGRFKEAVNYFRLGYEESPAPEFLYDIAKSYMKMGECVDSLLNFRRYLELEPRTKVRHEVEASIALLERQCGESARKTQDDASRRAGTVPATNTATAARGKLEAPAAKPEAAAATTLEGGGATKLEAGAAQPQPDKLEPSSPSTAGPAQHEVSTHADVPRGGSSLAILLEGGVTFTKLGALDVPPQASLLAGFALPVVEGDFGLEAGALFTLTRVPYASETVDDAALFSELLADLALAYALTENLHLRLDLGAGVLLIGGLDAGNPITVDRKATSTAIAIDARAAAGLEYRFGTSGWTLSLAPAVYSISPAPGAFVDETPVQRFGAMAGLGYRL